LSQNN